MEKVVKAKFPCPNIFTFSLTTVWMKFIDSILDSSKILAGLCKSSRSVWFTNLRFYKSDIEIWRLKKLNLIQEDICELDF